MKSSKKIIISIVLFVFVVAGIYFFYKTFAPKGTDKTSSPTASPTILQEQSGSQNNYTVNYALGKDNLFLKIKDSKDVFVHNTAFSTPEDVTVFFDLNDFEENETPLGYMTVVPTEYVTQRVKDLKLDSAYTDTLQEFMAFNSSNQCSILKPEDFQSKKIGTYTVWQAKRKDHCSFGLDVAQDQAMNMYGFETHGYTIILSLNGPIDDLPKDPNGLMEKVITLTSIE